jgi:hypothetical protein
VRNPPRWIALRFVLLDVERVTVWLMREKK